MVATMTPEKTAGSRSVLAPEFKKAGGRVLFTSVLRNSSGKSRSFQEKKEKVANVARAGEGRTMRR